MYIADFHIHSRFSRATSKDCDLPHLDLWARKKGIKLLGTGDFTHPAWRAELKEHLVPAEEGVYTLRKECCLPYDVPGETPRFVITGEISSIYKRHGKTRKVHNLILLPNLEYAEKLSARLEMIGNLHSDGRPILGLDSRDLLELTLDVCPDAELIPAHIWTPHFSMFGAFSGFDTIEECFDDLTPYIHAAETGLSSDPPMNWRVSALDDLTLVSNSDAHSPAKLGREANLLDTELSYPAFISAIRTGKGFQGTIEFFPEEGKYHLDGHRNCGVCLTPSETVLQNGLCPVCGKKLTIGVEHRVEELANRPEGISPSSAKLYERLAPLPEVIAASTGKSATGKKTAEEYENLLLSLGTEFYILREASIEEIEQLAGSCVAEGIRRLRVGQVKLKAGFDGEYGTISLLTPAEIKQFSGQISLFGFDCPDETPEKSRTSIRQTAAKNDFIVNHSVVNRLNPEQQAAVTASERTIAVIAGPGTGKTKTLVSRIVSLVKDGGVSPAEITAVTFTNQAAAEMRDRLTAILGGKRAVGHMTIGTFHAICFNLLGDVQLISPGEALTVAADILKVYHQKKNAKVLLQAVSQIKNGICKAKSETEEVLYTAYCNKLQEMGMLDFDDLLIEALKLKNINRKKFHYLLVDEFQDMNEIQYALIHHWSQNSKNIFIIGDPDQSIYSFRGASENCFQRFLEDFPGTREIRLKENYRSTPEILQAALPVIEKNSGALRILSPNCPSGAAVRFIQMEDDFNEGIFIAKEIARMTGGIDMLEAQKFGCNQDIHAFSDIAVLCRTHRHLELIEKCLRHDDIPCIVSGREDYLDSDEVRGILAFFRFLDTPNDLAALKNALRLHWNCTDEFIQIIQETCKDQKIFHLDALLPIAAKSTIVADWLNCTEEWLPIIKKEKPWKLIARWEEEKGSSPALEQLRNLAVFYSSLQELWNALTIGQEADLKRAVGKGWETDAVHLMTFHASKGLEFPAVFLAGLNLGTLPLESPGNPADPAEERRLFYVGMTRAQKELILTSSQKPSSFLADLPSEIEKVNYIRQQERTVEQLRLF
jgi:hypothetical protein